MAISFIFFWFFQDIALERMSPTSDTNPMRKLLCAKKALALPEANIDVYLEIQHLSASQRDTLSCYDKPVNSVTLDVVVKSMTSIFLAQSRCDEWLSMYVPDHRN